MVARGFKPLHPNNKKTKISKTLIKNIHKEKVVKNKAIKKEVPTKDEVISLLKETKNFSLAGKIKNVSDNAVRKWCKKYGIPIHKKDMLKYLSIN